MLNNNMDDSLVSIHFTHMAGICSAVRQQHKFYKGITVLIALVF